MSLLYLNVCTWNEADSTNGRKQVAWYDVTKCFVFHKAAILTNLLESLKHSNVKYTIKIKILYHASTPLSMLVLRIYMRKIIEFMYLKTCFKRFCLEKAN